MRYVIRLLIRIIIVVAVAFAASFLIDFAMSASDRLATPAGGAMMVSLLAGLLLAYALLIAVPFVPGIEIGVALLVLRRLPYRDR